MRQLGIVLAVVLVVALIGVSLYAVCGNRDGAMQCVRDIAIIVLVLETFVVTLLLALIVLLFGKLVSTIQDQVLPILASAKHTVDAVQGTTTFVSDTIVAPLIGMAGFGSAIKGTVAALFMRSKRRKQP
jgi:hypothetical protein